MLNAFDAFGSGGSRAAGLHALDARRAPPYGQVLRPLPPTPTKRPAYEDDIRRGLDYFNALGVSETATETEILSAFRARIHAVHPDHHDGGGDRETLELLVRARQTLTGKDRPYYEVERQVRMAQEPETSTRSAQASTGTTASTSPPSAHTRSAAPSPATARPAATEHRPGRSYRPGPQPFPRPRPMTPESLTREAEAAGREISAAAARALRDLQAMLTPEI